jgi:uncharacterized protein
MTLLGFAEVTMHLPAITATYLALLALLYAALGLRVARLRRRKRAVFGDADNAELRAAIRGHANFAEYVPDPVPDLSHFILTL